MWKLFQQLNYSKFVSPKPHPRYFARSRLIRRLDATKNHKYTLLHAPEGYGKSSLLSDWYLKATDEGQHRLAIWFRIDSRDCDPMCFWGNFIVLMDDCWPGIRKAVLDNMELLEQSSATQLVLTLANHIVLFSDPAIHYTMIFDDFESFTLSEAEGQFFVFADMLPSNVSIIIASKEYLSNQLVEQNAYSKFTLIGASELAMTKAEVAELLTNNIDDVITDEQVDELYRKSEGWPLALYILLEQIQSGATLEDTIRDLSGVDDLISDTVFKKATRNLPQKVMMFLLETSFFECFCSEFCNHVLENQEAQAIIVHLERIGLFTFPLDSRHVWYRYHTLFANWLRSQAMSLHRDQIRVLNHRAGYWYRAHKRPLLSAKHVVAASEGDFIAGLANIVFTRAGINGPRLLPWLFGLTERDLEADPYFCLLAAWAYAYSGIPVEACVWLDRAAEHIRSGACSPEGRNNQVEDSPTIQAASVDLGRRIESVAKVIESKCFTLTGNAQKGISSTRQLLKSVNPVLDDVLKMVLFQNLGEAYELTGETDAADKQYQKAMTIARINEFEFLVGFLRYQTIRLVFTQGKLTEAERLARVALVECPPDFTVYGALYMMLGQIALTQNNLDEIEIIMRRTFSRVSSDRNIDIYLEACIAQAQYLMIRRNYSEALMQLAVARRAIDSNSDIPPRGVTVFVFTTQIRLYLKVKDFESAEDVLREYGLLACPDTAQGSIEIAMAKAMIDIDQGKGSHATISELESLCVDARKGKYTLLLIDLHLLLSRLHFSLGSHGDATGDMKKAIELSRREQIVKPFLEAGETARLLLAEIVGSRGLGYEADKFSRKLLLAFDDSHAASSEVEQSQRWSGGPLGDPMALMSRWGLTNRENEVLQLLARGMNRKEIASELCTSQNTAKTHISHIYEKMGVHSVPELLRKMMEHEAL